jgi:hypothetical protein
LGPAVAGRKERTNQKVPKKQILPNIPKKQILPNICAFYNLYVAYWSDQQGIFSKINIINK